MARLPSLTALRACEAAARLASFNRAAQELHVTPAAVSHLIKGLELDLGVTLFRRMNRAVALTDAGQAMLPALQEGFARLAEAVDRARAQREGGILSVSVAPSFAAKWLVPRLHRFQAAHPGIDVRISATMHLVDFVREGIDAGIRYGRGRYPGLYAERLMANEVFPVASPALVGGRKGLRRPDDLKRYTLLHDESPLDDAATPTWAMWLKVAGVEGIDPNRGLRFSHSNLTLDAAIAGQGVALAKSALAAADLAAGRLVRLFALAIPESLAYWFACPPALAEAPKVKAFRAWLRQEAEGTGAVGGSAS